MQKRVSKQAISYALILFGIAVVSIGIYLLVGLGFACISIGIGSALFGLLAIDLDSNAETEGMNDGEPRI